MDNQSSSGGSSPTTALLKTPQVGRIHLTDANVMLFNHHYLGPVKTASFCYGHLEGCTVWGVLRSAAVHKRLREAGFNPIELIRMVGVPEHDWAMSSLLSHSLKLLFQSTTFDCAITYADRQAGHSGATYRAANWIQIQDAQPDGFTWLLDGKRVSRKRFYGELGTSNVEAVRKVYGDRIELVPDVPKRRFIRLRDPSRLDNAIVALSKRKTWGAKRIREFECRR